MGEWSDFGAARPPIFATAALRMVDALSSHTLLLAMRSGSLAAQLPSWADFEPSIRQVFKLDRPHHCFGVPPQRWAGFHEPQFTGGLAFFLASYCVRQRHARIAAFLTAAFEAAGRQPPLKLSGASAIQKAEAVPEENKVDLIVTATMRTGETVGAVIEAKFGHKLTAGQLPKAVRHARDKRGLTADNSVFLVVLPDRSDIGTRVFSKIGNKLWRSASWWQLMSRFEDALSADADDDGFRAFRRTLWQHAYL